MATSSEIITPSLQDFGLLAILIDILDVFPGDATRESAPTWEPSSQSGVVTKPAITFHRARQGP